MSPQYFGTEAPDGLVTAMVSELQVPIGLVPLAAVSGATILTSSKSNLIWQIAEIKVF